MAKSAKERRPTIAGFVPGEVEAHYEVDELNDEKTGKREVKLTHKTTGQEHTIPVGFSDPLFWYEAGLEAGRNEGQRRTAATVTGGEGGGQQQQRIPPGKRD